MRACLILVVLLCALGSVRASAQAPGAVPSEAGSTQSIHDVRNDYRIHLGPVHLHPSISLKELGIDGNVFNHAQERLTDFTLTVAPATSPALPFPTRALVTAAAGTDLVYYARYTSERSVDPHAVVRGEFYMYRLTLFAEDGYVNTRQRPNYEIDLRARHMQNDVSGGFAF